MYLKEQKQVDLVDPTKQEGGVLQINMATLMRKGLPKS